MSRLGIGVWRASEQVRRRAYRTQLAQSLRRRLGIADPTITRPIFLVGTVRSGTTYLARCVGEHPAVLLAGFELLREWMEIAPVEIAGPGVTGADCPAAEGDDLDETALAAIRDGFAALHVRKGGWRHTRLMNKNPHLWNKLGLVDRLFPDAHYLVSSRDLYSTVASTKRLWEKMYRDWGMKHYLPNDETACWSCAPPRDEAGLDPNRLFPGGDVAVLAEYWLRVYETIERKLAGRPRGFALRHAAFVEAPDETLGATFASLGLDGSASRLAEPVKRHRNQRWREILDRREIDRLDEIAPTLEARSARLTLAERALTSSGGAS